MHFIGIHRDIYVRDLRFNVLAGSRPKWIHWIQGDPSSKAASARAFRRGFSLVVPSPEPVGAPGLVRMSFVVDSRYPKLLLL